MFLSNLQFAISTNTNYSNINFKPKQVECLEAIHYGRDVVAVLPTGYGKSMIFHFLPAIFQDRDKIIAWTNNTQHSHVNGLARQELNLNLVVLELSKEKETYTSSSRNTSSTRYLQET